MNITYGFPAAGKALAFALVAAIGAIGSNAQAQSTTWRMASAFPDSVFHTQNIHKFIADVEKQTGGRLKIRLSQNSSLYKMPEIKRAVETRQVQIAEYMPSAYGNEVPIYNVDVVPYLVAGYDGAWKLYQATKPLLVEQATKDGLIFLYSVAWPGGGFYSNRAIEKPEDLVGNKMRSAAPITGKWTDRLKMTSTVIQLPELAQAFSTGMVNMMFTSSPMAPTIQAWQFTKYFYDLEAILGKNIVVVNKAAFDALAPDIRKAVLDAAAVAEKRGWEMSKTANEGYKKQMRDNGMWVGPVKADIEKVLVREAKVVAKEWAATLAPKERAAIEPFLEQ
ncbi:MAG: C4-dicarboxylate ABC transporter substrate-binding protein [Betaproteobacteria bacterium]|nr:MAG: C4-dicarboxylate ABC transporter substrate-binding protein [Betaproteobacteria bacterium]